MKNIYELKPIYTSQKSFYGKATVEQLDNFNVGGTIFKLSNLFSYSTHVATFITDGTRSGLFLTGEYSKTTVKHIREFVRQQGIDEMVLSIDKLRKHIVTDVDRAINAFIGI